MKILRNFKVFWSPRLSFRAKRRQNAPRRAKTHTRRPKMRQEVPKTPPRAPKTPPRRPQDGPRAFQDAPGLGKWSQNGAKLAFKSLQIEGWFRKSHNRSNRTLAAAGAGFSRVLGSIFGCKIDGFHEFFRRESARRPKTSTRRPKMLPRRPKMLRRRAQDAPKTRPRRPKTPPRPSKMPLRRSQNARKIGLEGGFDRNGRPDPLQAPILDGFGVGF